MTTKYFKPTSLTWWASVIPLLVGVVVGTESLHGWTSVVDSINELTGHTSAAVLINAGLAGIGIRGAL